MPKQPIVDAVTLRILYEWAFGEYQDHGHLMSEADRAELRGALISVARTLGVPRRDRIGE